jgi:glyoxylase I family protein
MAIQLRWTCPLLEVFDMPTSLKFYRDKLGFEVTEDSGQGDESGWVLLELGDANIMLNTAYDDGARPASENPARVAAHHDTTIYFGCPDVDAAYEHLQKQGIRSDPPEIAPYGQKQLYFTDPDNYNLCFQWPTED